MTDQLHPTFKRIFENHGRGRTVAQDVTAAMGNGEPSILTRDELILVLRLIDAADHMAGAEIGSPNWEAFCIEFQNAHSKAAPLLARLAESAA